MKLLRIAGVKTNQRKGQLNMKALNRRFLAAIAVVFAFAATAAAQAVVVGTGDPNLDVPAVQAAVDQGGQVVLTGHFSFDRPPTKPSEAALGWMVLVSKEVVISGTRDEHGEMTTIEGGVIPFAVEAPGAHVTIRGLRFVRPKDNAIHVYAASGLMVAYCKIEGVEPMFEPIQGKTYGWAISVRSAANSPTTDQPGQPEDISGTLLILNNDIAVGGTADDNSIGVAIFGAGKSPDKEVDVYVSGNNIRNTTASGIRFQTIGGRAHIERNVIATGATMGPGGGVVGSLVEGIKCQGSGAYLVAHNSIDSAFQNGAGIRVQGQAGLGLATERAIVVDNDVTMSAPEGTVFGTESAGIEIRGTAQGNVALNNRIRGRASFALSVVGQGGVPGNNTLVLNEHEGFKSSLADVFVGAGVTNTLVVGREVAVEDHGVGTAIVPMPSAGN
jgi:hypothetical protein